MTEIVNTLTLKDADFPELLRHVDPPPKQIFWRGSAPSEWLSRPRVAVVGSRLATAYGRSITDKLVTALGQADVVIISGLALGIDSIAHKAALAANGLTIAVLPGDVEHVYPPSHLSLADQILKHGGCLLSEYPSGTPTMRHNFIERNRLVSGLADILLITEAAIKSGTLHTARFALEQGKTVMVVPGNINQPSSEGCNNLIKSGALVVTEPADIFFALGIKNPAGEKSLKNFQGTKTERAVIELIRSGITEQDELARQAGLATSELFSTLTMLELAGHIRASGAGRWVLA